MREKPTRYEAAKELAGIPLQFDGKEFGYFLDRRPKDFVPPTDKEIDAKHKEMVKEWESLEYQRKRKPEYPSIEECVHALLDDKLEKLQAKRLAVKEKYPKPVVEEPIEEPKEVPSE